MTVLQETKGVIKDEFCDLCSYNIIWFIKLRGVILDRDAAHMRKVGGWTTLREETTLGK